MQLELKDRDSTSKAGSEPAGQHLVFSNMPEFGSRTPPEAGAEIQVLR